MTNLDKVAQSFVFLIVQAQPYRAMTRDFEQGVKVPPEERAKAIQSVLDAAGFFVQVAPWDPGTDFFEVLSGADDIESLLWLWGLFHSMERGKLERECQHVVDRILNAKKRRIEEENIDTTDYGTLIEAEQKVRTLPNERLSLWSMIANLLRSG